MEAKLRSRKKTAHIGARSQQQAGNQSRIKLQSFQQEREQPEGDTDSCLKVAAASFGLSRGRRLLWDLRLSLDTARAVSAGLIVSRQIMICQGVGFADKTGKHLPWLFSDFDILQV